MRVHGEREQALTYQLHSTQILINTARKINQFIVRPTLLEQAKTSQNNSRPSFDTARRFASKKNRLDLRSRFVYFKIDSVRTSSHC